MTSSDPTRSPTQRVLILGASSAIAQEVARNFAADGARFVLAGRQSKHLETVEADLRARGASEVFSLCADLDDVSKHPELMRQAIEKHSGLDVALLAYGKLGDQSEAKRSFRAASEILHTNFVSAVSWLTLLSEYFRNERRGTIAAIGSVAGDRGRKSNYVYGSAKGGLARFLEGLRNELFSSGVRVITVKPGFVDTPMTSGIKKRPFVVSPAVVGGDIYRCILGKGLQGKLDVVYTPWIWRLVMLIIRHIPETVFKRLSI